MDSVLSARWSPKLFERVLREVGKERIRYSLVKIPGGRPPLPTAQQLQKLVEVALAASLERDEGRELAFSLVFVATGADSSFNLRTRLALRPERIRRIASAVDRQSALAVSPRDGAAGTLGIWGVTSTRQDAVEVRAVGPAHVVVRFGLVNVARFEGTRCAISDCGVAELIEALSDLIQPKLPSSYVLLTFLLQLATAVRAWHHGGAFVVLAEGAPIHSPKVRVRVPFEPPFLELASQYDARVSEFERHLSELPHENLLYVLELLPDAEALLEGGVLSPSLSRVTERVSKLASIDGVVVLTSGLAVLGAGAFLSTSAPKESKVRWSEWRPGQGEWIAHEGGITDLGGARHQSAFGYVRENRGSIAVACSQDGGVSMLAWPHTAPTPRIVRGIERVFS